jgi:hypothetical protein
MNIVFSHVVNSAIEALDLLEPNYLVAPLKAPEGSHFELFGAILSVPGSH